MTSQHNLNAVQDPCRAVSLVLLVAAILGMWAAFVGGIKLANPAMLASGITLMPTGRTAVTGLSFTGANGFCREHTPHRCHRGRTHARWRETPSEV